MVTKKQKDYLEDLLEKKVIEKTDLEAMNIKGKEELDKLSNEEASKVIAKLTLLPDKSTPQQPQSTGVIVPLDTTSIVRPAVSVAEATQAWKEYVELTKSLLNKDDYAEIQGKKFKKKSAWRKYERFFNISVPMDKMRIEKQLDQEGRIIRAEITLEAVAPNGRVSIGWGACSINEVRWKGKPAEKSDHDIVAIAMTRARNRAVADLIGSGEYTAEEIE